jgi:RimJ/RimL family protein N-acetyltransferase
VTDPLLLEFPDSFETERLILRPPQRSDAQNLYDAVVESKIELEHWMPWALNYSLEESIRYTRRASAAFITRQDLSLAMFRKSDQRFVGNTGFHRIKWDQRQFEIGYWLRTSEVGKGYMTEAVNGLTRFGFEVLEANRIEIHCEADNDRSANVARRAGYQQEAHLRMAIDKTTGGLNDRLIFGMIRSDYDALIGKSGDKQ